MNKVANFLLEAEQKFTDYLNEDGCTNKQALGFIKKEFGDMAYKHCKELLDTWNESDGMPTPDDWR